MAEYFVASEALGLVVAFSPKCGSTSVRSWFATAVEAATGKPAANEEAFLISPQDAASRSGAWKVLFLRDPLRRLVGFYSQWVVRNETLWCFVDAQRRLALRGKTFREFLLALDHAWKHGFPLQHHLVPQCEKLAGVEFDQVVAVEQLASGLEDLNRRLGLAIPAPHANRSRYGTKFTGAACDSPPHRFREDGIPSPECFFDEETAALARAIYAKDIELYRKATGLPVLLDVESSPPPLGD